MPQEFPQPTEGSNDPARQRRPLFDRIGGEPFASIAIGLYSRIDRDPRIRAMFPDDLGAESQPVRDMREFLTQFFGGPSSYSERKGHPRLRARHMRFPIDQSARDAWLGHALGALDEAALRHALDADACTEIRAYLAHASQFMINRA